MDIDDEEKEEYSETEPILGVRAEGSKGAARSSYPSLGQVTQGLSALVLLTWVVISRGSMPVALRVMFYSEATGQACMAVATVLEDRRGENHRQDEPEKPVRNFRSILASSNMFVSTLGMVSYTAFILGVSFGRFSIATAGFGYPMFREYPGSFAVRVLGCTVFTPVLISSLAYACASVWIWRGYCASAFVLTPFLASAGMFWRFLRGEGDAGGLHALAGSVALLGYLFPAILYSILGSTMKQWHMEVVALISWLVLGWCGEGMLRA